LTTIPGVRLFISFADDAAGLLRTAVRSRGMTMFMEPKALYKDPKLPLKFLMI
jgi:2-oxoisovalerate dehydrogenase E1 component